MFYNTHPKRNPRGAHHSAARARRQRALKTQNDHPEIAQEIESIASRHKHTHFPPLVWRRAAHSLNTRVIVSETPRPQNYAYDTKVCVCVCVCVSGTRLPTHITEVDFRYYAAEAHAHSTCMFTQ